MDPNDDLARTVGKWVRDHRPLLDAFVEASRLRESVERERRIYEESVLGWSPDTSVGGLTRAIARVSAVREEAEAQQREFESFLAGSGGGSLLARTMADVARVRRQVAPHEGADVFRTAAAETERFAGDNAVLIRQISEAARNKHELTYEVETGADAFTSGPLAEFVKNQAALASEISRHIASPDSSLRSASPGTAATTDATPSVDEIALELAEVELLLAAVEERQQQEESGDATERPVIRRHQIAGALALGTYAATEYLASNSEAMVHAAESMAVTYYFFASCLGVALQSPAAVGTLAVLAFIAKIIAYYGSR